MTAQKGIAAVSRLILVCGVVACGGDSSTAPDDDGTPADGRILVANETASTLEVTYLREDEASGPRLVRTEVAPGTVVDVSGGGGGLLPAATRVELDLALGPVDDGVARVRRKVSVDVDGDVLVTIRLLEPGDPFSVETEVTSAPVV